MFQTNLSTPEGSLVFSADQSRSHYAYIEAWHDRYLKFVFNSLAKLPCLFVYLAHPNQLPLDWNLETILCPAKNITMCIYPTYFSRNAHGTEPYRIHKFKSIVLILETRLSTPPGRPYTNFSHQAHHGINLKLTSQPADSHPQLRCCSSLQSHPTA